MLPHVGSVCGRVGAVLVPMQAMLQCCAHVIVHMIQHCWRVLEVIGLAPQGWTPRPCGSISV
jgi:hypothetical protein